MFFWYTFPLFCGLFLNSLALNTFRAVTNEDDRSISCSQQEDNPVLTAINRSFGTGGNASRIVHSTSVTKVNKHFHFHVWIGKWWNNSFLLLLVTVGEKNLSIIAIQLLSEGRKTKPNEAFYYICYLQKEWMIPLHLPTSFWRDAQLWLDIHENSFIYCELDCLRSCPSNIEIKGKRNGFKWPLQLAHNRKKQ